ncbi:MAG: thermonuclease family protein [Elusimicrobia bacterium]|nr:thermonuclease family protein [Elusimicrobiota bacterium]
MGKGTVLSTNTFNKLVIDIQALINQGRERAKSAANLEIIRTYWAVGSRIESEGLTENAGYGDAVMDKLADALSVDRSTLVRCVQFVRAYPKGVPETDLNWSHIRLLLTVADAKERAYYQERAEKEHWTRDQLAKAINAEVVSTPGGKPSKKLKRPEGGPFIYRAEVLKVSDGDSVTVRLDLGFQVLKDQRIRLAGVDTPPLKEDGGQEALEYVQTQMAKAKIVTIRTIKVDIYGRYVGHVFYSFNENDDWEKVFAKGFWLNQELLDRGLARII